MAKVGFVAGCRRFLKSTAIWTTVFWTIGASMLIYDDVHAGKALGETLAKHLGLDSLFVWVVLFVIMIPLNAFVELKMAARRKIHEKIFGPKAQPQPAEAALFSDPYAVASPDRFSAPRR